MDSLTAAPVADVLVRLFADAEAADRGLAEQFGSEEARGDHFAKLLEQEARDYKELYHGFSGNFLNVSAEFGRFLYICARAPGDAHRGIRHIVRHLHHPSRRCTA